MFICNNSVTGSWIVNRVICDDTRWFVFLFPLCRVGNGAILLGEVAWDKLLLFVHLPSPIAWDRYILTDRPNKWDIELRGRN